VQNLEVVLIKGIKKPIHQGGHALGSRQHSMFQEQVCKLHVIYSHFQDATKLEIG
jgi:hypothetical protein